MNILKNRMLPLASMTLLTLSMATSISYAGVWTQPVDEIDRFGSVGWKTLELLPAWTGLPGPIPVEFHGGGPTTIVRDRLDDAHTDTHNGLDTINTEIVSFHLTGEATGLHTEVIAGFGNTFFEGVGGSLGLDHTRGQIQDLPGSPVDGNIDFPADSFFDVFFDIWVDLNDDRVVDLGEVLSNDIRDGGGLIHQDSFALRMQQPLLEDVPPPKGTEYHAWDTISAFDPFLGTFWATSAPLPLNLYPILPDRRVIGPAHARVIAATHRVPEPAPMLLFASALLSIYGRSRKSK